MPRWTTTLHSASQFVPESGRFRVNVGRILARMVRTFPAVGGLLGLTLVGVAIVSRAEDRRSSTPPLPAAASTVRYGRDIRPILADRCFRCHGPDAAKR